MLLDRHWIVRAALDRRIVGDDHAFLPLDDSNASDDPRRRRFTAIHPPRRQRIKLQKRRLGVAEPLDTLAGKQLVPRAMFRHGVRPAGFADPLHALAQLGHQPRKILVAIGILRAGAIYMTLENGHRLWISISRR